MKKENYIHINKQRNTDFLFSLEKTQYVRFFYKLPEKVRTQYYIFYQSSAVKPHPSGRGM